MRYFLDTRFHIMGRGEETNLLTQTSRWRCLASMSPQNTQVSACNKITKKAYGVSLTLDLYAGQRPKWHVEKGTQLQSLRERGLSSCGFRIHSRSQITVGGVAPQGGLHGTELLIRSMLEWSPTPVPAVASCPAPLSLALTEELPAAHERTCCVHVARCV